MIVIENLTKKFGENVILNNVNLYARPGEIIGIIGYNGCGKTVLLKCICGLILPTSGLVRVCGKIIGKDIDVPNNIGAIIETPGFLPNYDGVNNLYQLAMIKKQIGKKEIEHCMQIVGLNPKSRKRVGKYSLGMRQRLGLAQAIMENPEILILDEPMNGLDKQGVSDIRKLLLQQRSEGKTIVIASHSSEDIRLLCDTVYEIDQGEMRLVEKEKT